MPQSDSDLDLTGPPKWALNTREGNGRKAVSGRFTNRTAKASVPLAYPEAPMEGLNSLESQNNLLI
jgi:hypothetical protein